MASVADASARVVEASSADARTVSRENSLARDDAAPGGTIAREDSDASVRASARPGEDVVVRANDARVDEGDAASVGERAKAPNEGEEARRERMLMLESLKSFRAVSSLKRTLEVYCATWNVGNKAPSIDAAKSWLCDARNADVVAIGSQEASYNKSKKTLKPTNLSDALGDENPFSSKFKRKGFFRSTKWTRLGMMAGGAFAGGVLTFNPLGALCGTFTGWFASKKIVAEIKGRIHWFDFLSASLGDEFEMLQGEMLLQMRLAVFVRKEHAGLVRSVKVGSKATGIGNLYGNKGGLMVHIELENGETIAFVSCHLAAHEKPKFLQARNAMVPEILSWAWKSAQTRPMFTLPAVTDVNTTLFDAGSEVLSKITVSGRKVIDKTADAFHQTTGTKLALGTGFASQKNQTPELLDVATHVFFMGDLNYRLDPGKVLGDEWDTHWSKEDEAKKPLSAGNSKYDVSEVPLSKYAASRPPAQPGMHVEEESDDEALDESPFAVGRAAIVECVSNREFSRLSEADQLIRSIREGKVMANFREMPLTFYPTFKRAVPKSSGSKGMCSSKSAPVLEVMRAEPGTPSYYNAKRVPSWCDRVLVHSLPGSEHACEPTQYGACHDVTTSDHAPVFARFRMKLRSLPEVMSLPRAALKLERLEVVREFDGSETFGGNVWVNVLVPHSRVIIPEPKELSSSHVARDENQPKTVGKYSFQSEDLPTVVLGYDEEDEVIRAKRSKDSTRLLLDPKKLGAMDDFEDDRPASPVPKRSMDAYNSFVGIITLVDSRSGKKLGTCAIPLPASGSSSFDLPLLLYSERVGSMKGSWSISRM